MSSKSDYRSELMQAKADIMRAIELVPGKPQEASTLLANVYLRIGEALGAPAISGDSDMEVRLHAFMRRFNVACADLNIPAAAVVAHDDPLNPGHVDVRFGGHIPVVEWLKEQLRDAQANQRPRIITPGSASPDPWERGLPGLGGGQ